MSGDLDAAFIDGDLGGFVSYSVIDLGGEAPDAPSRRDKVIGLLRLAHDRLTWSGLDAKWCRRPAGGARASLGPPHPAVPRGGGVCGGPCRTCSADPVCPWHDHLRHRPGGSDGRRVGPEPRRRAVNPVIRGAPFAPLMGGGVGGLSAAAT